MNDKTHSSHIIFGTKLGHHAFGGIRMQNRMLNMRRVQIRGRLIKCKEFKQMLREALLSVLTLLVLQILEFSKNLRVRTTLPSAKN